MGRPRKKFSITGTIVPPGSLHRNIANNNNKLTADERWAALKEQCISILIDFKNKKLRRSSTGPEKNP